MHSPIKRPPHVERCRELPCVQLPPVIHSDLLLRTGPSVPEQWRRVVQRREVESNCRREFHVVHDGGAAHT